jgi:broad specificity phosphatase PhoE
VRHTRPGHRALLGAVMVVLGLGPAAAALAEPGSAEAWRALQAGGAAVLLRHASAPGIGDPPDFRLEDCSTQRILSAEGRSEANAIGDAFRRRDVPVAVVYSSQWCRCLETAELLGLGEVIPLPALNSFFEDRAEAQGRTEAVRALLAQAHPGRTTILVTHQVNITALTGVFPRSGEAVVVLPGPDGTLKVAGRIPPPASP